MYGITPHNVSSCVHICLPSGICSNCGCLLFGSVNANEALSNKRAGVPRDKDSKPIVDDDGEYQVDAQPPFLLRWSPSFFAREIPAMFKHDEATNSLSLKEGEAPPWKRTFGRGGASDTEDSWLYCNNCGDQHKKHRPPHIPFRDKAAFTQTLTRMYYVSSCYSLPLLSLRQVRIG